MNRRFFLKSSCALCGVAIAGSVLVDSCKKNKAPAFVSFTLDLTNPANNALNTLGGSVYSNAVIVARIASPLSASSFVALSQACTHQGCTVAYDSTSSNFVCPCHHGVFDKGGNVLSGPPPSPLTNYKISLSGNILTITS